MADGKPNDEGIDAATRALGFVTRQSPYKVLFRREESDTCLVVVAVFKIVAPTLCVGG
jgi:hypothetical protein